MTNGNLRGPRALTSPAMMGMTSLGPRQEYPQPSLVDPATVIQPKKPKDVAQSGDLSVLVEIGHEILLLLKCILALVLLVVVGIVYIVAMLS